VGKVEGRLAPDQYPLSAGLSEQPERLKQMPILTPMKQQITLGDVADINVVSGPTMLKTENARPASWIYIDARGRDMVSVVNDIKTAISQNVKLRPGTSVSFSGQFELSSTPTRN
jgi:Cu(I)/Ag(I) efflux system membrane protein CusA/SilA